MCDSRAKRARGIDHALRRFATTLEFFMMCAGTLATATGFSAALAGLAG